MQKSQAECPRPIVSNLGTELQITVLWCTASSKGAFISEASVCLWAVNLLRISEVKRTHKNDGVFLQYLCTA